MLGDPAVPRHRGRLPAAAGLAATGSARSIKVGVEGTGAYGAGLARYLTARGITVVEVDRPDRKTRRRQGKSDPIDADAAARAALAGQASGTAEDPHRPGRGHPRPAGGPPQRGQGPRRRHQPAPRLCSPPPPRPARTTSAGRQADLVDRCASLDRDDDPTHAIPSRPPRPPCAAIAAAHPGPHRRDHPRRPAATTRRRPHRPTLCALSTASAPTSPANSWSPPATTPTGSAPKPPSPPSAAPHRSPPAPDAPTATASTAAATAKPTPPCTRIVLCRLRHDPRTRAYVDTTHQTRPHQERDHPLPQALHRPRGLHRPPRRLTALNTRLTSIGASGAAAVRRAGGGRRTGSRR